MLVKLFILCSVFLVTMGATNAPTQGDNLPIERLYPEGLQNNKKIEVDAYVYVDNASQHQEQGKTAASLICYGSSKDASCLTTFTVVCKDNKDITSSSKLYVCNALLRVTVPGNIKTDKFIHVLSDDLAMTFELVKNGSVHIFSWLYENKTKSESFNFGFHNYTITFARLTGDIRVDNIQLADHHNATVTRIEDNHASMAHFYQDGLKDKHKIAVDIYMYVTNSTVAEYTIGRSGFLCFGSKDNYCLIYVLPLCKQNNNSELTKLYDCAVEVRLSFPGYNPTILKTDQVLLNEKAMTFELRKRGLNYQFVWKYDVKEILGASKLLEFQLPNSRTSPETVITSVRPFDNLQIEHTEVTDMDVIKEDGYGCYSDKSSDQILNGAVYKSDSNTTRENCAAQCELGDFKYSGVENGNECYCGNKIRFPENKIPDELCKEKKCSGNSNDYCGGSNKIWIYKTIGYGCYKDIILNRILSSPMHRSDNNNTKENCYHICKGDGFKYAGVEFGRECFCGNEIRFLKHKIPDQLCEEMKCSGHSTDFCAGALKIWIYSIANYRSGGDKN